MTGIRFCGATDTIGPPQRVVRCYLTHGHTGPWHTGIIPQPLAPGQRDPDTHRWRTK